MSATQRYIATNAEVGIPTEGDQGQTLAFLHANHVYPAFPGGDLTGDWQQGRVTVVKVEEVTPEFSRDPRSGEYEFDSRIRI